MPTISFVRPGQPPFVTTRVRMVMALLALLVAACNKTPSPQTEPDVDVSSTDSHALPAHDFPQRDAASSGSQGNVAGNAPAYSRPYGADAPMAPGSDGQPPSAPTSTTITTVTTTTGLMPPGSPGAAPASAMDVPPPAAGRVAAPAPPPSLNATELQFFTQAGEANIFESRVAQIAADRASDSAIKSYASLLMMDESGISSGLQQLSNSLGVPLPNAMSDSRRLAAEGLGRATPESFDRQFMQLVGARAQQTRIAVFEQTAREATNPAVRDFANATLPVLRAHLDAARKMPIQE